MTPPDDAPDPRELILPEGSAGRLDAALSRLLPAVSRRRLKAAFHAGQVRLDGHRARGADPARPGARVTLAGLEDAQGPAREESGALVVVHEDEALVVVDKPAGLPAWPLGPEEGGTLAGAVAARFPDLAGVGDLPLAPGLAHRLDVGTSGLLVFARTQADFDLVRAAFQARRVRKLYRAVVRGVLTGQGTVDVALGRPRRRGGRVVPVPDQEDAAIRKAWPALSHWRALEPVGADTLVEIELVTGVTHQARVHMAWLGHPLVGDARYGGPPGPRLMLHAWSLGLPHPRTGELLELRSPATFP